MVNEDRRRRFPTLAESKTEYDQTDSDENLQRMDAKLAKVNDAMRAVLDENERLKREIKTLRGRLGGITAAHNKVVEQNKALRKANGGG